MTDPLVQATADKYNLCIHVSKYMFYNGSTTTQLLKASPVQLSGKNRMSGNDREQLYLKLENDHYTFEKGIACIISLFPFIEVLCLLRYIYSASQSLLAQGGRACKCQKVL